MRTVDERGAGRGVEPGGDQRAEQRATDERLVLASRAGDATAFPALFDRWFDPCVDVAWRILRDRDAAADVAQEAFLAAWRELDRLRQPASFGGWVLRTARNRALDRLARARRSAVVSDDELTAALDGGDRSDETASAVEQAEGAELVWAASAALGERDASVLDLHLRHGFSAPEIAETLGVTANNAHQLLFRLKRKLGGAIQAWVLWPAASRPGAAACPELRRAVDRSGVTRFGAEAVRVVDRHARDCADCQERRQLRVAPEVLFGAVPIIPAGSVLRARTVAALQADGVPMTPTASTPGPGDPSSDAQAQPPDATDLPSDAGPSGSEAPGQPPDGGGPSGGDPPAHGDLGPDLAGHAGPSGGEAAGQAPDGSDVSGGDRGVADRPGGRGRRRWVRVAVAAVTAAVVSGLVVAVAAGGGEEGDDRVAAVRDDDGEQPSATIRPTTTTGPPPTVTVTTTRDTRSTTAGEPGTTGAIEAPGGPGTVTVTDPPPDPEPPPSPDPDPAAPEITAFSGDDDQPGPPCASHQRRLILVWESTGAETAEVRGPGAPGGGQAPSGDAVACVDPGQSPVTFTLTVSGPGGTATGTTTL